MLISCHLCKKIETIPKTSFLAVFLALLGAYLLDGRMFILLRRLRVRNRAFFGALPSSTSSICTKRTLHSAF